jgi:hypothetical protein
MNLQKSMKMFSAKQKTKNVALINSCSTLNLLNLYNIAFTKDIINVNHILNSSLLKCTDISATYAGLSLFHTN